MFIRSFICSVFSGLAGTASLAQRLALMDKFAFLTLPCTINSLWKDRSEHSLKLLRAFFRLCHERAVCKVLA